MKKRVWIAAVLVMLAAMIRCGTGFAETSGWQIVGDLTDWDYAEMTRTSTGKYVFTAQIDRGVSWFSPVSFALIHDDVEYVSPEIICDAAEGLVLSPYDGDSNNEYLSLYVSKAGTYTFSFDPAVNTLTVTNDLEAPWTFLILNGYPQRMVDPESGERVGEEDCDPPIEPYIFPEGRTLWTYGYVARDGAANSLCVSTNGVRYGGGTAVVDSMLTLTQGQLTAFRPAEEEGRLYDFYYCPETQELVIRKHLHASHIVLYSWCEEDQQPLTPDWWSEEPTETLFTISPAAGPYIEGRPVTVTAPVISEYDFAGWFAGEVEPCGNEEDGYSYEYIGQDSGKVGTKRTFSFDIMEYTSLVAMYVKSDHTHCTVTFDKNEGSDAFNVVWTDHTQYPTAYPMEDVRLEEGETFIVPECTMVPPDWKMFDHWTLILEDGRTQAVNAGDQITAAGNMTLKAEWKDRTFTAAYEIGTLTQGVDDPPSFFVHNFLVPYYPADMVKYTARGNKNPYEKNIYIYWYRIEDGARVECVSSTIFFDPDDAAPGGAYFQALAPGEPGDYEVVIEYKGREVVSQFWSYLEGAGPQGGHTYELLADLNKEYDGEPVAFDPTDTSVFTVDKGQANWGVLHKNGEARYLWRQYAEDGKESGYRNMEGVPTEAGLYQLVIQESDGKDWTDAAVFEFEITEPAPPVTTVTVTFETKGGKPAVPAQTLSSGEKAAEPGMILKTGSAFTGWYTDPACPETALFDFDTPVTADLILYAGWIVPAPKGILRLPADLTAIPAEAFRAVAAEAVIIPASVTSIAGNPFEESGVRYICGYAGSAAQELAAAYPEQFTFVAIDDAWLASH